MDIKRKSPSNRVKQSDLPNFNEIKIVPHTYSSALYSMHISKNQLPANNLALYDSRNIIMFATSSIIFMSQLS